MLHFFLTLHVFSAISQAQTSNFENLQDNFHFLIKVGVGSLFLLLD